MNTNLKNELINHIIETIEDQDITDFSELYNACFNTDYYIIGYYQASKWLKRHELDAFEAINDVVEYEKDNFGESHTAINSESIVNMYVYIKGQELINSLNVDLDICTREELIEALNGELK